MLSSRFRRQKSGKKQSRPAHHRRARGLRPTFCRSGVERLEDRVMLSVSAWGDEHAAPIADTQHEALVADVNSAAEIQKTPAHVAEFVPGEILVGFEGAVATAFRNRGLEVALRAAGNLVGPLGLNGGRVLFDLPATASGAARLATHWQLPAGADVLATVARLSGLPGIAYAEPNGIVSIQTHTDPADPTDPSFQDPSPTGWPFGIQEHLRDDPAIETDIHIHTEEAWHSSTGGTVDTNGAPWPEGSPNSQVIVAVVDTGVDLDHPDLDDNLFKDGFGTVIGASFVSGNVASGRSGGVGPQHHRPGHGGGPGGGGGGSAPGQDDNGHGTHVAGIIAAEINNTSDAAAAEATGTTDDWKGGTVGVAPLVKIMPVKVLNSGGSGSFANVASGITFAADNGAHIINMSLGGGFSQTTSDAVLFAYNAGVLVISSAGNGNFEGSGFPAADPFSLSIAAVDSSDVRAGFSNYGFTVDVAGPGVSILSTFIDLDDEGESGGLTGAYGRISGTSMSSPVAAGVAALIKSANLGWSAADVATQLLCTAHNIDDVNPGFEGKLGAGRVNALEAVTASCPAPVVIAVGGIGADGGSVSGLEIGSTISVQYSHIMDATSVLDRTNYELLYDATDDGVSNPAEVIHLAMVSTSYDAFPGRGAVLSIEEELLDGDYQLTVSGTATIFAADGTTALDGDRDGMAGGDYVRTFSLVPVPITTDIVSPFGALIYQGRANGQFDFAGDVDNFSIALDAGQTVSVQVESQVDAVVTLIHSASSIATPTDADPGPGVLYQTVRTTGGDPLPAGTLTIGVTGLAAGTYSVAVTLNALVDHENNDTLARAQSLDGSFIDLDPVAAPTASRGAVAGSLAPTGVGSITTEDESADTGAFMETNNDLRGSWGNPSSDPIPIWSINGGAGVTGTIGGKDKQDSWFFHARAGDVLTAASTKFSIDLHDSSSAQLAIATPQEGSTISGFVIPQTRDYWIHVYKGNGDYILNLDLTSPTNPGGDSVDFFSFTAAATDIVSVAGSGQVSVALLPDPSIPEPGRLEYTVEVTPAAGPSADTVIDYGLVVMRNATFDSEPNSDAGTAQDITAAPVALGYVGAIDVLWVGSHSTGWNDGSYNITQIDVGQFATHTLDTLAGFDVIYVDTSAAQSDPDGLAILQGQAGNMVTFVSAGDGGLITDNGGNFGSADFSWVPVPAAETLSWVVEGNNTVLLTDKGVAHPVTTGLTEAGLSGWGSSQHNYFDVVAAMDVLATNTEGQANVLADDFGAGRLVYFGLNPSHSDHQAQNEPAQQLIRQAVTWAAGDGAVDEDWYEVTVSGSAVFETRTPADGSGEFLSILDPHLELYDTSGILNASVVAVDLLDGRNETITVPDGTWKIRVTAEDNTAGEYILVDPPVASSESAAAASPGIEFAIAAPLDEPTGSASQVAASVDSSLPQQPLTLSDSPAAVDAAITSGLWRSSRGHKIADELELDFVLDDFVMLD